MTAASLNNANNVNTQQLVVRSAYQQQTQLEANSATLSVIRIRITILIDWDPAEVNTARTLSMGICKMPGDETPGFVLDPSMVLKYSPATVQNMAQQDWLWRDAFPVFDGDVLDINLLTRENCIKAKRRLKDEDVRLVWNLIPVPLLNEPASQVTVQVSGRALLSGAF